MVRKSLVVSWLLLALALSPGLLGAQGMGHSPMQGHPPVHGGPDDPEMTDAPVPELSPEEKEKIRKSREEARKITVARVNGAEIKLSSLVNVMNKVGGADVQDARQKAMDTLILQELAYQRAKAAGVEIDDRMISDAIQNFMVNLGGDEAYKAYLEEEGINEEDLRVLVDRSLSIERVFNDEVLAKIVVPEEPIKKEYQRRKEDFKKTEKILVEDVYFLKNDPATAKKAKEVLARLKADKNQDPWKLVLDGSFIVRKYTINKEKDKEMYKAAKKLKKGQLSGVISAPAEMHIIKLREYEPAGYFTYEEARNILEGPFRYEAQEKRRKDWEAEMKKEAKIEIIDEKDWKPAE